jgi:hypothetical protein
MNPASALVTHKSAIERESDGDGGRGMVVGVRAVPSAVWSYVNSLAIKNRAIC